MKGKLKKENTVLRFVLVLALITGTLTEIYSQQNTAVTQLLKKYYSGTFKKANRYFEEGVRLFNSGMPKKAEQFLNKALELTPWHSGVNYYLAILLYQQKKYRTALKHITTAEQHYRYQGKKKRRKIHMMRPAGESHRYTSYGDHQFVYDQIRKYYFTRALLKKFYYIPAKYLYLHGMILVRMKQFESALLFLKKAEERGLKDMPDSERIIRDERLRLKKLEDHVQKKKLRAGKQFLQRKQYHEALACFQQAPRHTRKVQKRIKAIGGILGQQYLDKGEYNKARIYYRLTDETVILEGLDHLSAGDKLFKKEDYIAAQRCYHKAGYLDRIAACQEQLGAMFKKQENQAQSRIYFQKAVNSYEKILKSYRYRWTDSLNRSRLRCMSELSILIDEIADRQENDSNQLKRILKGVGRYCDELVQRSIYFYCREHFRELKQAGTWEQSKDYTYSYQLVKKGKQIRETRKKINKTREKIVGFYKGNIGTGENYWKNRAAIFRKMFFGPVGILGLEAQTHFDYRLIGYERLKSKKTAIIECIPKHPFKRYANDRISAIFGKAWVCLTDHSVLKIEWEPKSVDFARQYRMPKLRSSLRFDVSTWFLIEKDGMRYPTKGVYEARTMENGNTISTLNMIVRYDKFKFFRVNTKSTKKT